MKRLLIGVLLLVGSDGTTAADFSTLFSDSWDINSKTERVEIAQVFLAETKKLNDFLPEPEPSDMEWLKNERAAIDRLAFDMQKNRDTWGNRTLNLRASPIFWNWSLRSHLKSILDAFDCVISGKSTLRREVFCWALASYKLSDRDTLDDAIRTLVTHEVLPADIKNKSAVVGGTQPSLLFVLLGRKIYEKIVIPYLDGQMRE